jgi:23S rRNA (uridine2552-2'-O)-methyltransferase
VKKNHVQDHYFHKAKREKYSARSVYKLKHVQEKYRILQPGSSVLDLGAAPGSWSEYVVEIIGPKGFLCALDHRPLSEKALQRIHQHGCGFRFIEASIYNDLPLDLENFDCVLSDLAPWTAGSKLVDSSRSLELVGRAAEIALLKLSEGGNFVVKLFQSEESIQAAKSWEKHFKTAKLVKPPSTHKESKEIYFVGLNFQP